MPKVLGHLDLLLESHEGIKLLQDYVVKLASAGQFGNPGESMNSELHIEDSGYGESKEYTIDEIADFTNGYSFQSGDYTNQGVGIVRMSDLKNGEISVQHMKLVSERFLSDLSPNFQVRPNDLVIGMSGSIGRPCFNRTDETFLLNQRVGKLSPRLSLVIPEFLALVLASREQHFLEISLGSAIKNLSTTQIKQTKVLLPPISIQRLIVSNYQEFSNLVERMKNSVSNRELTEAKFRDSAIDALSTAHSSEEFRTSWGLIKSNWGTIAESPTAIDPIRKLILDLAVRGDLVKVSQPKLVANIEWTTSDLKLDESKLWHLPTLHSKKRDGWIRIPLARIGSWGSGGTPTSSRKEYYENGTIPWAVIGDLNNDVMMNTETMITERALTESSSRLIPKGAILIAMYGASIGKTAISGIECCSNQAIAHCVVDEQLVSRDYFFIVAKSLKRHLIQEGRGAAQPNISQGVLKHLIIDIPSLGEQALIVDSVEKLLGVCDQLESSIHEAAGLAEKFSRSLVSTPSS